MSPRRESPPPPPSGSAGRPAPDVSEVLAQIRLLAAQQRDGLLSLRRDLLEASTHALAGMATLLREASPGPLPPSAADSVQETLAAVEANLALLRSLDTVRTHVWDALVASGVTRGVRLDAPV
jgi:hypothetical protein